jgi:hypothetical protein
VALRRTFEGCIRAFLGVASATNVRACLPHACHPKQPAPNQPCLKERFQSVQVVALRAHRGPKVCGMPMEVGMQAWRLPR